MTDSLVALLTRLSESGAPALLWGRQARPYYGRQFDQLLAEGVLVELAPHETWSTCATCECDADCRLIETIDGHHVALCPIDANADTILAPDDLRSFLIDEERLVAVLAHASGFEETPEAILPGIWRIGRLSSGRNVVVGLTRTGLEQPGLIVVLKAAAAGAPVSLVAADPGPDIRMRFLEAGIDYLDLRASLRTTEDGIDVLDRTALEPTAVGARLLIEKRARRVQLDGRRLSLSDQLFSLLVFLAEHAGDGPETVDFRDIEDHVWGAGIHRVSSGIREPIRALRNALAADAPEVASARALIENTRNPNGYRLRLDAQEIMIAD